GGGDWRFPMPKLGRFKLQSARRLRASMTDEERLLWRHLWRIPVEGTHFRRQASVSAYYPDFLSHRLKLIIEVDGSHHSADDQLRHDEVRTRWFESQGYRVVRFWNHEIKNELDSVLDTIYAAVEERKSHLHLRDGAEGIGG
ncbi:endonuclease domain-containing protein, partial [Mesorhizobium sp.]